MSNYQTKNRRIASNTIVLYFRLIVTLILGLYISRIVLSELGIVDYGIYYAVAGVVASFSIISSSLSAATQRYIVYSHGGGSSTYIKEVFSSSVYVHISICIIILLLAETIGLWFLRNKMTIPESKSVDAFWVYQSAVLSFIIMIMSVPYNALIIAYEKMNIYAYISLFDVVLKLFCAYSLHFFEDYKLIAYSIFTITIQLIIRMIYVFYCKRRFPVCAPPLSCRKDIFCEIGRFSLWSFMGNAACISYTQGVNILLNVFFGPVVNAARAVAFQVQSAAQQFVGGFQLAVSPQITKSYAENNLDYVKNLVFSSIRLSFCAMLCVTIPLIIETQVILSLWLESVPKDCVLFLRIILGTVLVNSMANPLITTVKASGKIKYYELSVGGILLMVLPLSYCLLRMGAPAYSVFIVHLILEIIAQIVRIYIVKKMINFSWGDFLHNVFYHIVSAALASFFLCFYISTLYNDCVIWRIVACLNYIFLTVIILICFGLKQEERKLIYRIIKSKIFLNK